MNGEGGYGLFVSCLGCAFVLAVVGACTAIALLFKLALWALT